MRSALSFIVVSMCLMACGSTTVIDGDSGQAIPSDVATDVTTDADTVSSTDTASSDAATSDLGQPPDTVDAGPPPCGAVGCPCDDPSTCAMNLVCASGLCCAPTCGEKVCGGDGCGGTCGECDGPLGCNQFGACMICEPGVSVCTGNSTTTCNASGDGYSGVPFDCAAIAETPICQDGACVCESDCEGKACGDDGCGGSCGACEGLGSVCEDGACVCESDCEGKTCGDDGCGESCGECQPGDACSDGQCQCLPQCDGLECGDDGCGGLCGPPCDGVCNNGLCESPVIPLGEACENPYEITKLPYSLQQGSTVLANDDEQMECLVVGPDIAVGGGRDEVYSVQITEDGTLNVGFSTWSDVGETHWPLIIYLKTSCAKECPEYVQGAIENVSTVLNMPVQQGQTVFIIVDGVTWKDQGTYNLNVQLNP